MEKAAVINFFGTIEYEKTLHEVRGLNVVVRLQKTCPILWPRLIHTDEKRNWIQLSETSVDDDIEYFNQNAPGKKNVQFKWQHQSKFQSQFIRMKPNREDDDDDDNDSFEESDDRNPYSFESSSDVE